MLLFCPTPLACSRLARKAARSHLLVGSFLPSSASLLIDFLLSTTTVRSVNISKPSYLQFGVKSGILPTFFSVQRTKTLISTPPGSLDPKGSILSSNSVVKYIESHVEGGKSAMTLSLIVFLYPSIADLTYIHVPTNIRLGLRKQT